MLPYFVTCLYWCLTYIREGISDLRIYVTVASPYSRDRGVTAKKRGDRRRTDQICEGVTWENLPFVRFDKLVYLGVEKTSTTARESTTAKREEEEAAAGGRGAARGREEEVGGRRRSTLSIYRVGEYKADRRTSKVCERVTRENFTSLGLDNNEKNFPNFATGHIVLGLICRVFGLRLGSIPGEFHYP